MLKRIKLDDEDGPGFPRYSGFQMASFWSDCLAMAVMGAVIISAITSEK